ncbi:MAG TPA: magnesium/cobalt transporter CorA [Candidatus Limnocylindrales bacterium]
MPRLTMPAPGTAGGIEASELSARASGSGSVSVTCVDYSPDQVEFQEVADIPGFLARHRPEWSRVRWINIDGLTQMEVIRAVAEKYQLHPLAIEDVVHPVERPKVEDFPGSTDQPGRLFIVARAIDERDGSLHSDQVSLFLGRTTLVTFQDVHRQDLGPIRRRIESAESRLRRSDVSFLLYALLDDIVDRYFPLLESYSERLTDLDEELLERPTRATLRRIQAIKRELLMMRRAAWPLRDVVAQLQRDRHVCLSETAQTYLRDVHDHCVQIIDLIETYREISNGLAETYLSEVSNRTNDTVKLLTIIGTIFIPLTFLAGVYGMNMPIPENQSAVSYPLFWLACLALTGGMLAWFRRRGWI